MKLFDIKTSAKTLILDLGELFDEKQFINDVSGAGNNWFGKICLMIEAISVDYYAFIIFEFLQGMWSLFLWTPVQGTYHGKGL